MRPLGSRRGQAPSVAYGGSSPKLTRSRSFDGEDMVAFLPPGSEATVAGRRSGYFELYGVAGEESTPVRAWRFTS